MAGTTNRTCCWQAGGACSACESRLVALWSVRDELQHMLCRRGASMEAANDAVAETFLVVWRRLEELPVGDDSARAWMFTTAKQSMANLQRRQEHQQRVVGRVASQPPRLSPDPVSERVLAKEAFASLSPSDRALLYIAAGLAPTQGDLAAHLRCSTTAATSRLWRARSRLNGRVG